MNRNLEDIVWEMRPVFKQMTPFRKFQLMNVARRMYPYLSEGQVNKITMKAYRLRLIDIRNKGHTKWYFYRGN
jgi:hypothetical protein